MLGLCDDEDHVGAGGRRRRGELAHGRRATIVLDRRDDQSALADVGGGGHGAEAEQRAGLDRAIEHAGDDLADRDLQLAHRVADRAGKLAALIVELALLGDVREVERIGVSLILMGGAVTDDDDVAALAQGREPFGLRLRGLACRQ